jgi:uncharacterized membrane protein YhhN
VIIAFTILYLAGLGLLLVAEYWKDRSLRYRSKPLASAAFVAIGLLRAGSTQGGLLPGEAFIVAGLVLGAVGDVLLMFAGQAAFLGGLVAFLLGHLAYVVAFAHVAPPDLWVRNPTPFVVLWAAVVLRQLWRSLGDMRGAVVVYVATICVMVAAAFAVYRTGAPDGLLVAIGASAFAVSDVAVARERFVSDTFVNKAWGLPLYYGAQLLLAWSIGI